MTIAADLAAPSEEDVKIARESSRKLASLPTASDPIIQLPADIAGQAPESIKLPRGAALLLVQLLNEMGKGNAVTLMPIHAQLTTQQAAEILGVSRPFLVKELQGGNLPFHMVGTHRRIFFKDLMSYKDASLRMHNDAMNELTRQAQELNMGY